MTSITTMHDGRVVLHQADCRDVLRGLSDNSIDSVVTDPPYALVSIQKRFGKPGSAVLEGFQFVGCEREDEYMPIATARIAWAIGAVSKEDERPAVAPQQPAANDNDLFSVRAA